MPINKLTFKVPITEAIRDRFMSFVDIRPNGCWLWTGHIDKYYGKFSVGSVSIRLPRAAWLVLRGAIPDGLEPDHLCKFKPCANPDHMELVTHGENVKRGDSGKEHSSKTHCPRGHEYSGDNLKTRTNGARKCRECNRIFDEKKRRNRGSQIRATHCTRGHLMTHENVKSVIRPNGSTQRLCIACRRIRESAYRSNSPLPEKLCGR